MARSPSSAATVVRRMLALAFDRRAGASAALSVGLVVSAVSLTGCSTEDAATPGEVPDAATPDTSPPIDPSCGRLTTPCPSGGKCDGAQDCQTSLCREGVCRDISPSDGIQNGDETDVDCGGTASPACPDGKKCLVAPDCTSGVCTGGVCQVPSPTDKVKNGDETDVDCGGSKAPKCKTGQGCTANGDCDNVLCDTTQKKCAGVSDSDNLKNGDETGVDCGGPTTPKKCPTGQGCAETSDCNAAVCNATTKVCDPPSKTDAIKNGTESDVDCGGGAPTNADRCKEGQKCEVDSDCADPYCSIDKKCVVARSCKGTVGNATAGIVTCGKREVGQAGVDHESCCRSLPLPSSPAVRLDKYEVTSGRFRQFIETVGPNIRQWVANEIAAATPTGTRLAADLPTSVRSLLPASATPGEPLNLVMQIGSTVMDPGQPSMVQGCYQDFGDANGAGAYEDGAYGANTYWWPRATLQAHHGNAIKARRFTQQQYDEKSMNCGAYWMYAAFCSWDGGRMPTAAEMADAWGPTQYPWGTGVYTYPLNPGGDGFNYEQTANYWNNNYFFYHFPDFGDARDLSGYISAPGRFPLDKTIRTSAPTNESWMDLGANMMEMTKFHTSGSSGSSTFCDASLLNGQPNLGSCSAGGQPGVIRATGLPGTSWVGGSWEGHYAFSAGEAKFAKVSYNFYAQTQYGKTGFRCAR